MGAVITLPGGEITTTHDPGVVAELDQTRGNSLIRRLVLSPHSPLYPAVNDRVSFPKSGMPIVPLRPGWYVVEVFPAVGRSAIGQRYLLVEPGKARWSTEAEALIGLGALEALKALGLDDAAVSLSMHDLDAARVQWIRWKDEQR